MLADILQTCLTRIDAGASVDACLAAYPQQRDALEAPLNAAVQIRTLPRPVLPAATQAALETRMLALAAQRRAAAPAASSPNGRTDLPPRRAPVDPAALLAGLIRALGYRGPLARPWLRLASAAIALVLALALGTGAFAAARAIVRAIQGSRNIPTTTLPASTPFTLDGPIAQIAPDGWVVNGIAVALDAQTTIDGTPVVGAVVHVGGDVQTDATLLVRHITVEAPHLPATSVPIPSSPPSAPTTLPVPPPNGAPDGSDESGKPDKPKPDKPKPGKPGKGKGND
ncbi:MAG: DUF5666 domain-containing protein [Roseiflexaceae bacterium]